MYLQACELNCRAEVFYSLQYKHTNLFDSGISLKLCVFNVVHESREIK